MPTQIGIALVGCGQVGSAVAEILLERAAEFAQRCGRSLVLRHVVVRDPRKRRPLRLPEGVLTSDLARPLADARTLIVVELVGGVQPAAKIVSAALEAGKDVVTANKALLAERGAELFSIARKHHRCIAFEAAVGGGIPIIESVRSGLVANHMSALYGILNGTCNYILTRMLDNDASYAHALAEAQRLGYAESDPALDVSGTDSAHKLAILSSIAMRAACAMDHISTRGITGIELVDLTAGRELGYVCKLLAVARQSSEGLELSVRPTFIDQHHPLAGVHGPFNAVSLYGDVVGHTLLYGRGAGGRPTAGAVLADVISVALGNAARTFESLRVLPDQTRKPKYRKPGSGVMSFYLRLMLADRPGGVGKVSTLLGRAGISLATIVQHEPPQTRADGAVPVVVMTHPAGEAALMRAIERISQLDVIRAKPMCIPVLEEDRE